MMQRRRQDGERGFVLISVLVISTLYFALILLILWESTLRYRGAQAFRARVIAQTLAENAVELAAGGLTTGASGDVDEEISDGLMHAEVEVTGPSDDLEFHINAEGRSAGVQSTASSVEVWGRVRNGQILIERTKHSQQSGASPAKTPGARVPG